MKSFKDEVSNALYISAIILLLGVSIAVFAKTPRFGFYFVGVAAINLAINIAYITFGLIMSVSLVQRTLGYRKANPSVP